MSEKIVARLREKCSTLYRGRVISWVKGSVCLVLESNSTPSHVTSSDYFLIISVFDQLSQMSPKVHRITGRHLCMHALLGSSPFRVLREVKGRWMDDRKREGVNSPRHQHVAAKASVVSECEGCL